MKMRQKVLMLALLALLLGQTAHAFYNPVRGTWLSRDPIEERGGINLYEMGTSRTRVGDFWLSKWI